MNHPLCRTLLAVALVLFLHDAAADSAAALPLKPRTESDLLLSGIKAIAAGSMALLAVGVGLWHWRRKIVAVLPMSADRGAPVLVTSRRMSQKTILLVVQWQDRVYLLAESGGAVTVVADMAAMETPP